MLRIWLLVSMGLLFVAIGLSAGFYERSYRASSATAVGKVTSKPIEDRYNVSSQWHVEYRFDYEFTVAGTTYRRLEEHAHERPDNWVTVYYRLTNPKDNQVNEPESKPWWIFAGLGVFFMLVGFAQRRKGSI